MGDPLLAAAFPARWNHHAAGVGLEIANRDPRHLVEARTDRRERHHQRAEIGVMGNGSLDQLADIAVVQDLLRAGPAEVLGRPQAVLDDGVQVGGGLCLPGGSGQGSP
jgi:hypothetical protein